MVLLCGIHSETPIERVNNELIQMGEESIIFNQRMFETTEIEWELRKGKVEGWLYFNNTGYRLENFSGVYSRFMSDDALPELLHESHDSPKRKKAMQLQQQIVRWMELSPARIVNKYSAMLSNGSKPYQAQIIRRHGLDIPPTIITNNPEKVLEFRKKYPRIIYKSISGVRSIVQEFSEKDADRLEKIRWCPVQFQALLDGYDVRVHVIGNKAIATKITSESVDYRYASRDNNESDLIPFELQDSVKNNCIELTKSLGLAFSGIDLKFSSDGKIYCFEVNPMPGYSYFEANAGQPIARTLAEYLVKRQN